MKLIRLIVLTACAALIVALSACGTPQKKTPPNVETSNRPRRIIFPTARRQISIIRIPLSSGPTTITLHAGVGAGGFDLTNVRLFEQTAQTGIIDGPSVEQFFATPTATVDLGSILTPAALANTPAQPSAHPDTLNWKVTNAATVYLEITTPADLDPGNYILELSSSHAPAIPLEIRVADLTLPIAQSTLALATTDTATLSALYPNIWTPIQGTYLDRADPTHAAAIKQLDALVIAAQRLGINFYVEDVMPSVHVDEVGRVHIDWSTYDRTMAPYMDGSAFANKVGLEAWLAPQPPRRIRDSYAQLRQYWQECIEHARDKAWATTIVLSNPSLVDLDAPPEHLQRILSVLRNDIDPSVTVVCRPGLNLPQKKMWATDEALGPVPPTGVLATAQSVRVWPWMSKARGLQGFVWRNALGRQSAAALQSSGALPLWVGAATDAAPDAFSPTLRLAWLSAGLNDIQHFNLLTSRSDPQLADQVLAGVVGRTGVTDVPSPGPEVVWQRPTPSFLYAGWPTSDDTWQSLDDMIDVLTLSATPGEQVKLSTTNPMYLQAKQWLATTRRPAARLGAFTITLDPPTRGAGLLKIAPGLVLENPLSDPLALTTAWPRIPDRWLTPDPASITVPPHGFLTTTSPLNIYLDVFQAPPGTASIEIKEPGGLGGSGVPLAEVAVKIPVIRMHVARIAPPIDGKPDQWPAEEHDNFGPALLNTPYLNHRITERGTYDPIIAGDNANDPPARAQFLYDADNIYVLLRCPQTNAASTASQDRTSDWPLRDNRWWDSDGLQLQIGGGSKIAAGKTPLITIAVKPSGTVLTRTTIPKKDQPLTYTDGPAGVRYGVTLTNKGWTATLAIPRKLFVTDHDGDPNTPIWRLNLMRYRNDTHQSASWSGPLIDDQDYGMMGVLMGESDQ